MHSELRTSHLWAASKWMITLPLQVVVILSSWCLVGLVQELRIVLLGSTIRRLEQIGPYEEKVVLSEVALSTSHRLTIVNLLHSVIQS